MKQILSVQNSYIKSLIQLQEKARARKQSGTFLIEGRREIELAIAGGYKIRNVLFVPELTTAEGIPADEAIEISPAVYEKLAYRESTEGMVAVAASKDLSLSGLRLPKKPLLLVAESIEKPGNLGALLRTADAAAVDAVIIADAKSDMYNPNIIRSSVGCLFTNQIAVADSADAIAFLKSNDIDIFAATLQDAIPYHEQDFSGATALVVGTEATGLTQPWREASKHNIMIPMQGAIDSMNVSVAAAILIFEAKRQRGF
ncbi:TrmH family RNA methyltransferase [Flavobacterium silvaticum]|uniref:RNA methyltransferase n=1 Tax=Flavobacterium silvaticum TaxID=1852020 RepID=A0A972FK20_9FLAO|nr:RNA methyltransferase [Flavobacterium silvaticum]NMH26650.1 RNA methyltransferase [Flavobacterium silvaticum]